MLRGNRNNNIFCRTYKRKRKAKFKKYLLKKFLKTFLFLKNYDRIIQKEKE